MHGITVFTPTYNRAHTLERAYNSLVKQKYEKLEWLIIDDGSTDETPKMIEKFIAEGCISIHYVRQRNKGKYIAHNVAAIYAEYEIFLTLDSDDYLLDNALSYISKIWEEKQIADNEKCAGILAPFDTVGTSEILTGRSNLISLYTKKNFKGEITVIWKTSVISRFLVPRIENEKFLVESVYMRRIDKFYYYECTNIKLEHREYYEDGLTKNIAKITRDSLKAELYAMKNDAVYLPGIWEKSTQYLRYLLKVKGKKNAYLYPELSVSKWVRLLANLRLGYRKMLRRSDSDLFCN